MLKKCKTLDLKPTQFAVGMLEVDEKLAIARKYSKKELKNFVKETRIPVVISPQKELYLVDNHHFLCVCLHMGIKKVNIRVVKDFSKSKISYIAFWKWMFKNRSAYPYCQFGEGPRKALYLPKDIRGIADDPYRSLAWFVRKSGAFENSDRNFAEFQWANFFRSKNLLDRFGTAGLPQAFAKAAKLAQSKEAKHLPGFGELNLNQKKKSIRKAKSKGLEIAKK